MITYDDYIDNDYNDYNERKNHDGPERLTANDENFRQKCRWENP